MYFEVFCKTKIALTSWMTISRYFEMFSLITKSDIYDRLLYSYDRCEVEYMLRKL